MGWSMTREPRTIVPGRESIITIEMDEGGKKLSDVEITFEINPSFSGSIKEEKVKTDANGCAKATFVASEKIAASSANVDAYVKAKWKIMGQDKENTMLIEIRPGLSTGKK